MLGNFIKRMAPLAAMAMGAGLSACGSADFTINGKEGVPLAELDTGGAPPTEIMVAGSDRVILTEGDALDIKVEGDSDAVAALRFVRDGELLGVTRERDSWNLDGTAIVRVTMPAPKEVIVAGSGAIEAAKLADRGEVVIGGSGSVSVAEVGATSLEIAIGGSGDVTAAGTTERLEVTIGGSGDADLAGLKAARAEVSIGGSGSVAFASDGTVEANIAGSGNVDVTGRASCTVNAIGSGTLTCTPSADSEAPADEPAAIGS